MTAVTARSSGPGPWPWVLAVAIVAFGALGFVWATSGQPRQPLIVSAPGDGSADAQQTMAAANATTAAFLTAPSPTATATSTPLPKPIPTSTPIPVDQLYPACAPDTPGGSICRPEPPPETPTPYPLCADGSYPRLCVVPTSVMHGMTEVETE